MAAHMADELTTSLLRDVSRSFYLSMHALPTAMRTGVSIAYLLARATDSVADSSSAPAPLRLETLHAMARVVAGEANAAEETRLLARLGGELARAQAHEGERRLLQRYGEALAAFRALSEDERTPIRRVLATIVEGQIWDLTYFDEHPAVENEAQTLAYAYQVAGCVGEFWTSLGYATMGASFAPTGRQELMAKAGARYGRGLQLVNILRDAGEDAARGRQYLANGSDRRLWLDRAERWLRDGLDYSRRLRRVRLRFASMLPALIGLRTLALLRRHDTPKPGERKLKIPRRAVYACMVKAFFVSILPPIS